jgi:hypothetical protein
MEIVVISENEEAIMMGSPIYGVFSFVVFIFKKRNLLSVAIGMHDSVDKEACYKLTHIFNFLNKRRNDVGCLNIDFANGMIMMHFGVEVVGYKINEEHFFASLTHVFNQAIKYFSFVDSADLTLDMESLGDFYNKFDETFDQQAENYFQSMQ